MKKVIIVDDEPIVVNGLSQLIQWNDYGFEVAGVAYDGGHALELIREVHPELVFTDIRMPVLSGIDLISRAKLISQRTKFVIFSAYNDFEYIHKALRLNVFDYVDKPVTVEKLQEILSTYINVVDAEHSGANDILKQFIRTALEARVDKAFSAEENVTETDVKQLSMLQGVYTFFCCAVTFGSAEKRENIKQEIDKLAFAYDMKNVTVTQQGLLLSAFYAAVVDADAEDCLEGMRELCDRLVIGGQEVYAGASDLYSNVSELRNAIEEAIKAAEFGRFYDEGFVRSVDIPAEQSGTAQLLSATFEQQLTAAVCSIDEEKAERLEQDFLERLSSRSTSVDAFRHDALEFAYLCHRIARNMGILPSLTAQFPHLEIQKYHSVDRVVHWLHAQFHQIMDALQKQQTSKTAKSVEPAKQYIDQYYMRGITLTELSSLCGMSSSYFSLLFKLQIGQTYVKYINQVRMERARDMLTSNMSIRKISENTGFISQRYFTERFKAYWGCTPTQFRQNLDEENTKQKE